VRTIVLMFDSLNRLYLPAYGGTRFDLPNFRRLESRTVTFDRCYAGSMPCMPARREMHTGRPNFLHRGWGPLEPFDDSSYEILGKHGVYTHLVTDHVHYWEDGGATYHPRFSSYEFIRGQEGDPWKGHVADPVIPPALNWRGGKGWRQDWINRAYTATRESHFQTKTLDAGLEFIDTNAAADNWLLQIECFDPHEPFFTPEEYHGLTGVRDDMPHYDWPDYRPVLEDGETVDQVKARYGALLKMCDDSLGRLLDRMDAGDMWKDTILIVCTDHGLLIGERDWYGKNVQPWYEETIHTPLFVWDPVSGNQGTRDGSLVQTVDFAATFLDAFGLEPTPDMQSCSILQHLRTGAPVRETALFGIFGGHVSITDGRYVYMRACATPQNRPLEEFTLMPTRMKSRFSAGELRDFRVAPPFSFTKGVQTIVTRGGAFGNPHHFGTLLFDLETDPDETTPLNDPALETRMATMLVEAMRRNDAPASQYERLGLPETGPVEERHLLIERQWPQIERSRQRNWKQAPAESYGPAARLTIAEVFADPALKALVDATFGFALGPAMVERFGRNSLWALAVMSPGVTPGDLHALDDRLVRHQPA